MITTVDCVYRLCEKAEPCVSTFNIDTGKVEGIEEFMNVVNLKELIGYGGIESRDYYIEKCKYYNLMYLYPKVKLCIDYYGTSIITIDDEFLRVYLVGKGFVRLPISHHVKLFNIETRDVGIVKSPVFTYEVSQSINHMIAFKNSEATYLQTRYGIKKLPAVVKFTDLTEQAPPKLNILLEEEDKNTECRVYGYINIKGKRHILYYDKSSKQLIF